MPAMKSSHLSGRPFRARGHTPAGTHVPVLPREVIAWLRPARGEVVADCTVGYGSHAVKFLEGIGRTGRLIGFDVDGKELERARPRLAACGVPLGLYHRNFTFLAEALKVEGLDGADIIFADLGVSGMQVDDPSRGISYKNEGPLDMRMDDRLERTGADLLATLSREELSAALRELSDEPDHERIADWLVRQRAVQPITRTSQLVRLVFDAKGLSRKTWREETSTRHGELHPAARTFQALRILVNNELENLKELLRIAPGCLRPGGRIGIIGFHSGEDRLVKRSFREGKRAGVYRAISDSVIQPRAGEVRANPRSASAKFRWARKEQAVAIPEVPPTRGPWDPEKRSTGP